MSDATELEKRLEQHRCENSDCWLDVTNKACAVELIRAYVAERVAQAFSDGAAQHEKVWGAALMNEIANLKAHRTASVKTDNGWELTDYAYLCKLEGDVERLVEALREALDDAVRKPSNYAWIEKAEAALALFFKPVAPKEKNNG